MLDDGTPLLGRGWLISYWLVLDLSAARAIFYLLA